MMKQDSGTFTGRHMLAITLAFFGVIALVNTIMAVSATRTWTGLVVPNSYVASQHFQDKVDAVRSQNAAGWTFALRYEGGVLAFEALEQGQPLHLDGVEAFIHRPVGGQDDQTLALEGAGGTYRGQVMLAPGAWDVVVTSTPTRLGVVERETRISVP